MACVDMKDLKVLTVEIKWSCYRTERAVSDWRYQWGIMRVVEELES